ncbi:MAG: SRPBCC domain-containing protein [Candidatus Eisenbacteria bacterium]|uniref:SRPBCC domain-containing protein n=1 Tax=Eiseniibacteriota bacterium TaxID=2212470 RepID=A0A956LVP0_UNCEI|nr:SRPBCC domain-containing protein [Candidatus Eisenbacteria bacterium]
MSNQPVHFIVQLHGIREGWPQNMSADEQRIMGEHFGYLQALMWDGKVLLAGPCQDPVYGLVVLEVSDEAEARSLMDREPSVLGGVHTYTLHPFHASLLIRRELMAAEESDRRIRKQIVVDAARDTVWTTWTTTEGVTSFGPPEARIQLRVGGRYEWYFGPAEAPLGTRGSEGCRVLSYLAPEMLSLSWNAPPTIPALRPARTRVVVQLAALGPDRTEVTLTHLGFGRAPIWNEVYDYFESAWGHVLESLAGSFRAKG